MSSKLVEKLLDFSSLSVIASLRPRRWQNAKHGTNRYFF
jgi:hypothetical protein